jgi:hypothetical protein
MTFRGSGIRVACDGSRRSKPAAVSSRLGIARISRRTDQTSRWTNPSRLGKPKLTTFSAKRSTVQLVRRMRGPTILHPFRTERPDPTVLSTPPIRSELVSQRSLSTDFCPCCLTFLVNQTRSPIASLIVAGKYA